MNTFICFIMIFVFLWAARECLWKMIGDIKLEGGNAVGEPDFWWHKAWVSCLLLAVASFIAMFFV